MISHVITFLTVSITNENGETPREVAIRFAHPDCIALLAPNMPAVKQWEGEEAEFDHPSPISVERAKKKVEEMEDALQAAKTRFRELGGELPEDNEIKRLKEEHQQ